jgi:diaminohydroxyphosphoribosylaminopyrimidine deaminase/5-amino-6-(5-phosphoribosylamino)uracil reductase
VIAAGVKEVVAAMGDPNPMVSGRGFARLRKAGVRVRTGILREEAEALNRSFIHFMKTGKPYVILKSAMSLDGKIAAVSGDSKWISSEASRRLARRLRTEMDAILVGGETVRRDDPSLTSHGLGRDPVRVVLTNSGRLPPRSRIFDGRASTWILQGGGKVPRTEGRTHWFSLKSKGGKISFPDAAALLGRLRDRQQRGELPFREQRLGRRLYRHRAGVAGA